MMAKNGFQHVNWPLCWFPCSLLLLLLLPLTQDWLDDLPHLLLISGKASDGRIHRGHKVP